MVRHGFRSPSRRLLFFSSSLSLFLLLFLHSDERRHCLRRHQHRSTTRQSHKSFFEKSDLFFVCMMQHLSFDIQKQDQEIEAAQWMAFEEYPAQPFVQKNEFGY
ncbi:PREDICTED: nudix hydrolase 10-like [Prunus mume]|uniref:Nudix hydrolase 10-like n=1 Tax=Prunus mume TaxID=102107 RepID=A0ABM0NY86_PRUMU|nr:PREDICTED: nudix hydrolase 10-like [Prunus mume]